MSVLANAMTVDVEDYFQVSAFAPVISPTEWDLYPCRIERNIDRVLSLLGEHNARATFFTLGWIAKRYPQVVRRIVESGHEIASHGFAHQRASDMDRSSFREDVVSAKRLLEDLSGTEVKGYRAPSFSIGKANWWALETLTEAGYRYSSSVYPIRHDHYGVPDAPRFAFRPHPGLVELPITTVNALYRNWPAGGGGYFRLFPYALSRSLLRSVNVKERQPCIFYFHPWELDVEQPRPAGIGIKTRFRHYVNLQRMEQRLARLLTDFRWDRADNIFLESSK
jgi:polysaccharide deacetylase family protein (PEP-CTERM system associated)